MIKGQTMKFMATQLPSVICFTAAAALALAGAEGWGWFLFIGLMVAVHYK